MTDKDQIDPACVIQPTTVRTVAVRVPDAPLSDRDAIYLARRIVRAAPGGATHKRLLRDATPRVLRLVDVLPDLLAAHCIAEAERLALLAVPQ